MALIDVDAVQVHYPWLRLFRSLGMVAQEPVEALKLGQTRWETLWRGWLHQLK
jgi:hypothetical protein